MRAEWILAITAILAMSACGGRETGSAAPVVPQGEQTLKIEQLQAGQGPAIRAGQHAVVHYTGWLYDAGAPGQRGEKFDSSVDRGQPFSFPLGAGRVIRGWDEGVAGMQVGERRVLVIPPDLAYGQRGAGGVIPPGATLVFEVELLGIDN